MKRQKEKSVATIRLSLDTHDSGAKRRYDAMAEALADLHVRMAQVEVSVAELREAVQALESPQLPFNAGKTKSEEPSPNGR
jgi:oligoendopeptidase F